MRGALAADLHGSRREYQLLARLVEEKKVDVLFLAGDLGPSLPFSEWHRTRNGWPERIPTAWLSHITNQHAFAKRTLPELLNQIPADVILILGNNDVKSTTHYFRGGLEGGLEERDGYARIDATNKRVEHDGLTITGYPYVPVTPHYLKEWEKIDVKDPRWGWRPVYEALLKRASLEGVVSDEECGGRRWRLVRKEELLARPSIEEDLQSELFATKAGEAVWLCHTPPYGTSLDLLSSGLHVGSIALRRAVQELQPRLLLCGHIHKTCETSGSFLEVIGKTVCLAAGNGGYDVLSFTHFPLDEPARAVRERYAVTA